MLTTQRATTQCTKFYDILKEVKYDIMNRPLRQLGQFFLFAPSLSPSRCSPVEWRSWSWRWSWSRRYLNPLLSCGCGNLLSPMLCIMSLRFVMLKLNACSTCPAFSTECHWQPTKTKYKKLNNNKRKNKNNDDKLMSLPQGSACCPCEALSAASA